MLKDMDVSPASPGGGTGTVYPFDDFSNSGGTYFNKSSMSDITSTSSTVADNASGWYFTLEDGEKVTSNAVTLSGVVYFNSFQPTDSATSCDSLGTARSYAVRLVDGMGVGADYTPKSERYEEVAGGGLLPSPVPGIVEIDGKLEQVVISGTHVTTPIATELSRRYRVSRGNLLTPD
jgi:type IV pilus assembly protein PilY1